MAGQVNSGPRPHPDVQRQVQVQGGFPRNGPLASLAENFTEMATYPKRPMPMYSGYPYPRGLGPLKWCSKVCTAINFRFLGNVHWSKVADLAQVSNGRSKYQAWSLGHLGWNLAVRGGPSNGRLSDEFMKIHVRNGFRSGFGFCSGFRISRRVVTGFIIGQD